MTAVFAPPRPDRDPKPLVLPGRSVSEQILVKIFVLIPFAAVPIAWGWGPRLDRPPACGEPVLYSAVMITASGGQG